MPLSVPAKRCGAAPLALGALVCLLAAAATAPAATLTITGPAGLPVTVNGQAVGPLPLAEPLTLAPGIYEIAADLKGYKSFRQQVVLADEFDYATIHVRPDRLSRSTAVFSNILFAGLGQHYYDADVRGWIYNAAEAGGLITALVGELQRSNHRKDYLLLQDRYNNTINGDLALEIKAQTEQTYADMKSAEDLRNTGLIVAAAAIGVSMLDALITFPAAEIKLGPVPPASAYGLPAGLPTTNPLTTVHAGFRLGF